MELMNNLKNKVCNFNEIDFNPFEGGKLLKAIPITKGQLEIWVACIIGGDETNCSYNLAGTSKLTGKLNQDALLYSLKELIRQHEILRSTFSADGKLIYIYENPPHNYEYHDISGLSMNDKNQFISNIHYTDANTPYNLEQGPLFRYYLIKVSENEHLLKLGAHHLVCDGWSFGVISETLSKLYSAYIRNEEPLLDAAIPYSQYAADVIDFSNSDEYKKQEKYWIDQYKNDIPVLDLPTDNPRPVTRTFKCDRSDFSINGNLLKSIKNLRTQSNTSLATILIATFETYLHLLTKQSTTTLGMPTAGQVVTGNYQLVGHCVNLLPLKSRHNGESTFIEYLNKRKVELISAYENQRVAFSDLLNKLNIPRDSSRIPLVPVMLSIVNQGKDIPFVGLEEEGSNDPRYYDNFEISIFALLSEEQIELEWTYNSHLFNSATIQRMFLEFETLLKSIISKPETRIKDISTKTNNAHPKERKSTSTSYPKDKNVSEFIDERCIENPLKTAVYFKETELTYQELNDQSNQLAHYLIQKGVKKGDIIGLLVDRSLEMIISLVGIMKAGAAYLPLDPTNPKGRIDFMLEDSSSTLTICSNKYTTDFKLANQLILEDLWPTLNNYPKETPSLSINGNDLAYILYTSGSTGKPKGVMIEHHSLTNYLLSFQKEPGLSSKDRLLAMTTISFDIAATEMFLPLITGASIFLVDSNTARDGETLLQTIKEKEITVMQATPTTWQMMLSAGWETPISLKVMCGGEAMSKDLAEKLLNRAQELWNVYGPTETTVWSSIKKINDHNEPITIGNPIANTQIYILDEHQKPVANGTPGEIYIAGDGLARGYLNRAELTAEKFIHNPFDNNQQSKMYATGDLGLLGENGEITCLGRIDAQVKIRGHRIELGEIEYSLVQLPGIKEAVVIAQGDNLENQNLIAYILFEDNYKSGTLINSDSKTIDFLNTSNNQIQYWKNELKESLPDYMVPRSIFALNFFPTNSNNKIDRKKLPIPIGSTHKSDQVDENTADNKEFIAPKSEAEKIIAKIWSELLYLDSISVNSNFFEMGGNSLIAIQAMKSIEKATGTKLPFAILFENSTIEKLAEAISGNKKEIKWKSTSTSYPKDKNVSEFIDERCIENPLKTAVYFKETELTYQELNDQSNQLAHYLIQKGVKKGDIIGLLVDRSLEMIISLVGIMKAGAAYLPLDPTNPKGRIDFMLEDSSSTLTICSNKYTTDFKLANQLILEDLWPTLNNYPKETPSLSINGNDLAYILYTSGSTGKPKGVMIEHHSLTNYLLSFQKEPGLSSKDRLLAMTTISFDIAATEMFLPLITGASIFLVDSNTARDGETLLQTIKEKEITVMQATPTTWQMMLSAGWETPISLKVMCGGEAMSKDLAEKLLNRAQELWNVYGPTETTVWCTIKRITNSNNPITIGHPIANTQIYILDEHQKPVANGTPGEIYIAGDGLARGYLNRPELTAEKFIHNPFDNHQQSKMYATGDLGILNENGEITCLGRIDAQIKIRGHRIELGEIEYSLVQLPGIKEAVVIAQGDNLENQNLIAYILFEDKYINDGLIDSETIDFLNTSNNQIQNWKNELKESLPGYMVPHSIFALNRFPINSNNKIDRKKLPEPIGSTYESDQVDENIADNNEFIAPKTETEKIIAKIWSELLHLNSISVNSNFFEMGGNSLIAIQAMKSIEKATGIRLPLATLFENSTIEKLTKIVTEKGKEINWNSLVPIKATGTKTPIYLVHGLGLNVLIFEPLRKYMDHNQPIYALQGIGLNGDINNLPNSIEELAQLYNTEILKHNPNGPYILAGYSLGGVLVHEMSKQLLIMGKEVKMLAVIDTNLYLKDLYTSDQSSITIKNQFLKLFYYSKSYLYNPIETLRHHLEILRKRLHKLNIYKYKERAEQNDDQKRLEEIYMKLYDNYQLTRIDIKIDLLKCRNRIYFLNDKDFGWNKYTSKGVNNHEIAGDHSTCFQDPNVKKLSKVLQKLME